MELEELNKVAMDWRYGSIKSVLEKTCWPEQICSQAILAEQAEEKNSVRGDLNKGMHWFGYGVLKNVSSKDGRWKIGGKNATMYFKLPKVARPEDNPDKC